MPLQVCGRDQLGSHAGHPEVGRCSTRGESQGICDTYTSTKCEKGRTHSGFETQRRHHQKSKTGVSVAPQKGLMSYKNFKKKYAVGTFHVSASSTLTPGQWEMCNLAHLSMSI